MATAPLFGNAGFVYETPGGVLRRHRLRWPLRDVEPVHRRRRYVRESLDMSVRQVITIGAGVSEILATIRYEDVPEDLLEMLIYAADGVEVEYWEDLDVASSATPFLVILDDPETVHLLVDRDRHASHGEYEVRLRLRRTDGRPPLPINANVLANAGFEQGGARWTPASAVRQYLSDPTKARTGKGCLEVTGTAQLSTTPYTPEGTPWYVPVQPGDVVTLGCWVMRVSGDGDVGVWGSWYDADKVDIFPTHSNLTSGSGDWERAELTVTAPAGAAFWRGGPYVFANDGTVGRFDDAYLYIKRGS